MSAGGGAREGTFNHVSEKSERSERSSRLRDKCYPREGEEKSRNQGKNCHRGFREGGEKVQLETKGKKSIMQSFNGEKTLREMLLSDRVKGLLICVN